MSTVDAVTRLAAARLSAVVAAPYYASALFALVPHEKPGLNTLGVTEHAILMYDPAAIARWTNEELAGVLVHEISHLLRGHIGRARAMGAIPKLANLAEDMEINDDLRDHWPLPDGGGCQPEAFGFEPGKMMEEYYLQLLEKTEFVADDHDGSVGNGACGSCAGEAMDGEPDGVGRSDADMARVRKEVATAVKERTRALGVGSVPAHLQVWADQQLQPPTVRWDQQLRTSLRGDIANTAGAVDLTYLRPSRRQAGLGYGVGAGVMSAPVARTPRVMVAVDTSGSMGDGELRDGVSEVDGILRTCAAGVEIVVCDADVHGAPRVVRTWQEAVRALVGGGGTDFRPVFDEISKRPPHRRPDVLVFVTDGGGPAPAEPLPGLRTIWLLVGEHRAKPCAWGTFIEVDRAGRPA